MSPMHFLYFLVLGLIRTVKWIELQFLKLFSSWIIRKATQIAEELGGVLHFSDESYQNWRPVDDEKALEKCAGKYDTLVHLRVRDDKLFVQAANTGTWGIGESYVNGLWDFCKDEEDLAEFTKRVLENSLPQDLYMNRYNRIWHYLEFKLFNLQTRSRSWEVAKQHYDLGNDLYEGMLDPNMQYTCAYWANADNLNDAQLDKLELIAKKLKLKPGMRVLDLGCGWGTLCKYFAERHGVECVGVTISKEGVEYGRRVCKGLPVEIRLQDYRDMNESFDRVVAIGLLEHVGLKNYKNFFNVVRRNLKDDGIFLCHTIGENHINPMTYEKWLCTHIFPGGSIPRARHITEMTEGLFIIEDWHNFSLDYSKTLVAWRNNFKEAWPLIKDNYGERFYRMWIYYLTICEAGFLSRRFQLWQIVLSKDGLRDGYISAR